MIDLKSKVVLPSSMQRFFEETGASDGTYFEGRRVTRMRIRREAPMRIDSSPPSIQRSERAMIVLVKDISRSGISFLAHEQLWPEETIALQFLGRHIRARIVRCRRLDSACWECGAEITHFENQVD